MSAARKSAKGQECQIRLEGICNGNPETTVMAHLPGGGMGGKQPDFLAAYACLACHQEVDGVTTNLERDFALMAFYEGVFRTQEIMYRLGILKIK